MIGGLSPLAMSVKKPGLLREASSALRRWRPGRAHARPAHAPMPRQSASPSSKPGVCALSALYRCTDIASTGAPAPRRLTIPGKTAGKPQPWPQISRTTTTTSPPVHTKSRTTPKTEAPPGLALDAAREFIAKVSRSKDPVGANIYGTVRMTLTLSSTALFSM